MVKTNAQNLISWIAIDNDNNAIGHIYMLIEIENKIKFMDAWVSEEHRGKGIFNNLWETRWQFVENNFKGYTAYAWCLDTSLPLLKKKGFEIGQICTYVSKKID